MAEIMIWDGHLSMAEMLAVDQYMEGILTGMCQQGSAALLASGELSCVPADEASRDVSLHAGSNSCLPARSQ
eukprot:449563-Rhodomonas_salina.2